MLSPLFEWTVSSTISGISVPVWEVVLLVNITFGIAKVLNARVLSTGKVALRLIGFIELGLAVITTHMFAFFIGAYLQSKAEGMNSDSRVVDEFYCFLFLAFCSLCIWTACYFIRVKDRHIGASM